MSIIVYKTDQSAAKHSLSNKKNVKVHKDLLVSRFFDTYKALHIGGSETLESRMIRFTATACHTHTESEMAERIGKHKIVCRHLAQLSDAEFGTLLEASHFIGSGTGGKVLSTEVTGVPVFIKKIPLTTLELQNLKSTRDPLNIPLCYQYGVGSMGFGAVRELSVHKMTNRWVLEGECHNFPLTPHARVVKRTTPPLAPTAEELESRKSYIAFWDGSSAVGARAEALATASADVVIVMESLPQTLYKWLQTPSGKKNLMTAESEMQKVIAFMKSRGLLHFDGHAMNVLHLNNHVYYADYGLALSRNFHLSSEEETFFDRHSDYDRSYMRWDLLHNLIGAPFDDETAGAAWDAYMDTGKIPTTLSPEAASMAKRYRPIAILMDKFFKGLREVSKSTPYPEKELAQEWATLQKTPEK